MIGVSGGTRREHNQSHLVGLWRRVTGSGGPRQHRSALHCSIVALQHRLGKGSAARRCTEIRAGECSRQAKFSAHLPPEDRPSGLREQGSEEVQAPQLDREDPGRSSACSGRGRAVPVVRSTCTSTSTTLALDPPEAEVDYPHRELDAYAHRGKKGLRKRLRASPSRGGKKTLSLTTYPYSVLQIPLQEPLFMRTKFRLPWVYPFEMYLAGNLKIGLS
ncbi:hypothetical protein GGI35DRAFT_234001 [Trichoderma velutinum]